MDNFDYTIDVILANEGGFVDDPVDRGKATNFGITLALYQSLSPGATINDLKQLNEAAAKKIYKLYFWQAAPFDQIDNMRIATSVFDASVNSGIKTGIILAQKACNSLTKKDILLDIDGRLGYRTLRTINKLDPVELLIAFRNERKMYYEKIIENDPTQERFRDGWMKRSLT